MPYTAAQLTQYYTAVNQGQAPDQATQLQFQAAAQQNANGQLSDAATLRLALGSAQTLATTDVALATYEFFTGSAPSAAGLNYLVNNPGTGFNTSYFNGTGQANGGNASATNPGTDGFNLENRYYNEAIALASTGGAGNANFLGAYGGLTINQTIAAAYETIVGTANVGQANANAAIASIQSSVGYFTQVAQQRAGGVDAGGPAGANLALKAIIVGYILEEGLKADVGTYAKAIDQFNAAVANNTAVFSTDLVTYYGANGAGFGTGVGAGATTTTTFNFTNQPDNPNGGGSIFYNSVVDGAGGGGPTTTLTAQDTLTATGGNNTLRVTTVNGFAGDVLDGALVSGVQTLSVRNIGGAGVTFKYSGTQGGAASNSLATVESFLSTSAITFGDATGGNTSADALKSGIITQVTGNAAAATGAVTANYAKGSTVEQLNIQNGTTGGAVAITTGGPTATLTVNSTGTQNTLASLTTDAQKLIINATTAITAPVVAANITDLTISGAGAVNLGAGTIGGTKLVNVTSTNTNALKATFDATALLNVTLGAAGDTIIINGGALNAKANINLGAGNDTLTLTNTPAAGVTINGGDGTGDTLSVTAATAQAFANPATFTTAQAALISGFETLGINDVGGATTGNYNPSVIGATNLLFTNAIATGATATVQINSGSTITIAGDTTADNGALVVNTNGATDATKFATDKSNTNDVLNINLANTTAEASTISTAGVETLNFNATGTGGVTLNLTDAALKALSIVTSEAFTIGTTGSTVLTTITESGAGAFGFTSIAGKALVLVDASGSTGVDTINVAASTNTGAAPIVVKAGTAADILTFKDFATVTGGGANDTFNVGVTTSGQTFSTITDEHAGNQFVIAGATSFDATAVTGSNVAVFQDFLDAAAAKANGTISYFQFGGDTYIAEAGSSASNTFNNGVDTVVKLVGLHDLSASTFAGGALTTGG